MTALLTICTGACEAVWVFQSAHQHPQPARHQCQGSAAVQTGGAKQVMPCTCDADAAATLLPHAKQTAIAAPLSQLLLLGLTAVFLHWHTMCRLSCACDLLSPCVVATCMPRATALCMCQVLLPVWRAVPFGETRVQSAVCFCGLWICTVLCLVQVSNAYLELCSRPHLIV